VNDETLIQAAIEARKSAYAPYSGYRVGAAALATSGRLFSAGNIENASYGLTVCAERAAIFKAVSEGEREIRVLAVATEDGAPPCGACRQVLFEFGMDARVLLSDTRGTVRERTLAELLPEAFDYRRGRE
jgi:cytidine deaminase